MTTPKPTALPELPEPFALSVSVHEGDTPAKTYVECMLYQKHPNEKQRLYTADQMRAYALAALQAQPAEVSDAEWWHEVLGSAGSDLLGLAKKWDANEVHVYQFVNEAEKIVKAAAQRAILALRPQAVPMTDEVKEKALDLLETMFDAYENGVPCHEDNGGGYIGMAFSLDNETFHACADILNAHRPKAHHGITAHGAQGGV